METMKKKNKSYTATCPFLHLQKCISNNPLMETIKKKISRTRLPVHSPFADVYK